MTQRTFSKRRPRQEPAAPSLRQRAAELRASIPAPKPSVAGPAATSHAASVPRRGAEPDPALAVVTVFRASWDALGKVLDTEAPDGLVAELEDAQGAAYDRLKAVQPTTAAGFRALAECWAMVLKGHRGEDPGMTVGDHAADSLIAGAGACVPVQSVDWYAPPPGFMASPAIEPFGFAQVSQGLQIELQRLRGIAWAEYHRLTENLSEHMGEDDARAHRAKVRAELFLPALTAAIDPDSDGARALATLDRPAGPDPVFALIEAHQAAYAVWEPLATAQNCTRVGSPEYIAASEAEEGPSKAEVAAYNALFSARPTTIAGTMALAGYLQKAVRQVQIEPEPEDGERALTTVVAALRATVGLSQPHTAPSLVDQIDFASASLEELQALHDIADLVGGVAYAVCWQSRAHTRGWTEQSAPGDHYNAAGKLMQWLGDALTDVETAANDEARRRGPTRRNDRETRLEMLARPVIQNGDLDETEAFARELLAHVEAERAGR